MKLDLMLSFWGKKREDPIDAILEAERLGYDTAWFAETYGSDAFSPLSRRSRPAPRPLRQ
jgi:alkanesulfonate monooxygenase SsuD/methylene tetrahydromethanopterin reductase-like flavin-dependent oxidoreductase (luciferase family)